MVWIGNMIPIKLTKSFCIHQSDSVSDPKLSPVDMSNLLDKKVSAPLLQFFSAEATMSFVVAVMSFS